MELSLGASRGVVAAVPGCGPERLDFGVTLCERPRTPTHRGPTLRGTRRSGTSFQDRAPTLQAGPFFTFSLLVPPPLCLARYPFDLRSGRGPLGEPTFEEDGRYRRYRHFAPSLKRAMRKNEKLQNWVVDTWARQSQKSS